MNMRHLWVLYDPIKETQSEKLTTEETQFVLLRLKTKYLNKFLIWREDWPKWKKLSTFLESPESPFMNVIKNGQSEKEDENEKSLHSKSKRKSEIPSLKMVPATEHTMTGVKNSINFSDVKIKELKIAEVFGDGSQQFDGDNFFENNNVVNAGDLEGLVVRSETPQVDFKTLNKRTAFSKRNIHGQNKIELLLIHPKSGMFRTTATDISLTGTFCERIIPAEYHNNLVFDLVIINNLISDDDYKRITVKASVIVTDSRTYLKYVNLSDEQKNALRAGLDYYVRAMKKKQVGNE